MAKQQKKVEHRPMPQDPRGLARAMFNAADGKIMKGQSTKRRAASCSVAKTCTNT